MSLYFTMDDINHTTEEENMDKENKIKENNENLNDER